MQVKGIIRNGDVGSFPSPGGSNDRIDTQSCWVQGASTGATFNLIVGTGDTPPRPGEFNGGLQNLPRFLENFNSSGSQKNTTIFGSFVQAGRSKYATAPYQSMKSDAGTLHPGIFGNEDTGNNKGRVYRISNSAGTYTILLTS